MVAYYARTSAGQHGGLAEGELPAIRIWSICDAPALAADAVSPALHGAGSAPSPGREMPRGGEKRALPPIEAYIASRCALQGERGAGLGTRRTASASMVLAGRPYHIDPEIGHGIDRLAASLGFVVVSEDSVCHLAPKQNVHVLDQWTFHARLYRAARLRGGASGRGAGAAGLLRLRRRRHHDRRGARAFSSERASIYTQIKIDEITNLGAVQHPPAQSAGRIGGEGGIIMQDKNLRPLYRGNEAGSIPFSCPTCCRMHFELIISVFEHLWLQHGAAGGPPARRSRETGLKYAHNDACYPAILVIGQFMHALQSGKYDPHKVGAHYVSDRRRLPRIQLYFADAQGAGAGRAMAYVPVISFSFGRAGEASGLPADASDAATGCFTRCCTAIC